jgi:hypothetical protein
MSLSKRQTDESEPVRKPKPVYAQNWVTKPLDNAQKAKLSIAAREAYELQTEHGLATGISFDDWRHEQVEIACGKSGLRKCTNKDFRAVLARFFLLAGKEKEAAEIYAKTGRVKGSEQIGDTHENRELCRALIRDKIAFSYGAFIVAYVAAIVRNKHQGKTIDDLSAAELQQLVYTVTARLNKKT